MKRRHVEIIIGSLIVVLGVIAVVALLTYQGNSYKESREKQAIHEAKWLGHKCKLLDTPVVITDVSRYNRPSIRVEILFPSGEERWVPYQILEDCTRRSPW